MADEAKGEGEGKRRGVPRSRPIPGAGTPEGDLLREALHAFDAGDFATVRRRCRELAEAEDAAVRAEAEALASRIAIDPVQVVILLACTAVLFTIVYVWVL